MAPTETSSRSRERASRQRGWRIAAAAAPRWLPAGAAPVSSIRPRRRQHRREHRAARPAAWQPAVRSRIRQVPENVSRQPRRQQQGNDVRNLRSEASAVARSAVSTNCGSPSPMARSRETPSSSAVSAATTSHTRAVRSCRTTGPPRRSSAVARSTATRIADRRIPRKKS